MMRTLNIKPVCLVILATLLLSGCIAVREHHLPSIDEISLRQSNSEKLKLFSEWTVENDDPLASNSIRDAEKNIYNGMFESAIMASGCCTLVDEPDKADIVVTGVASNGNPGAGTGMLLGAFWGATACVIPSWVTIRAHIQADVQIDEKINTYEIKDSMKQYVWLPIIVAMPFKTPPTNIRDEMDTNAFRNLVAKMQGDGILESSDTTDPR